MGFIAVVLKNIQHSSPCGSAALVDTIVRSAFVASCDHLLSSSTLVQVSCSSRSAWRAVFGHVWHYAHVELRGCGVRTACRRGYCYRRCQTRTRGARSGVGTLGLSARHTSPSSTCGGLLLHSAEIPCLPPSQSYFGNSPFL